MVCVLSCLQNVILFALNFSLTVETSYLLLCMDMK